ncbi:MAG: efflux RND transporter permease subunit [Myxococcales bacterium]|nr:efflux RND transporter permease subunit [Myxococcales bacterium]
MIAWLVSRRTFVYLIVFCTVAFGFSTYFSLPREASPDVQIPLITVTTPYIGVSPEDVESLVTVPLENELSGVKDLKKMTSTSYEGLSVVMLEFEPEVNIQDALQRVRDRVNRARPKLPDEVEETEIGEINFSDLPIVLVTLGGPIDELELKRLGEKLEDDLRRVPGVLDAVLSGGRKREIQVHVDPNRLAHYGLALNDVTGAIANENVNIPGGDVRTGQGSFLLRIPGEIVNPRELEGVAIKRVGDRPVFIRDIGRVVDGFAPRTTFARMNGRPAVSIAVSKRTGSNIVEVVDGVKAVVASHAARWPDGLEWRTLGDQSKIVHDMVGELENGIITGLILVVAVLLFFMGVRNSFFVALAIPLSMLLAFVVVAAFGMTLNMIVLFSLIMALGMLVDNAIVLVENIYRHVEEGKNLVEASIVGTKEVAGAVAASTATTVAAFLPLVFWTGVMGQFMGYLPKTIIIVLIASLVVAIVMLPVFTSQFMRKAKKQRDITDEAELDLLRRGYKRVLEWSIRRRYVSLGLGVASLVGTFMAYGALNHGTEFFPDTEPDRAFVAIRAPLGTDLESTDRISREVEALLAAQENVDVFVAEVGVAGGQDPIAGSQNSPNHARITVDFLPDRNTARPGQKVRVEPPSLTIDRLRDLVAEIPGAEIRIEKEGMGPPVGKPIDVRIAGEDFHRLGQLAARVRREIAERVEGATDLTDDYRVGRPEMRLRIDRGAAKRVGASTQAVAGVVRTAVNGSIASTIRDGEKEYDIVVQLAPEFREDLQSILSLRIDGREDTSPDTFPVPLSSVARFELAGGSGAIQHIDQDRVVSVTGDVAEGFNANAVQAAVLEYIGAANMEMPDGYHISLGGSNDEQEQTAAFMGRAFQIALALILIVLVYQFNRLDIPLIILTSVVLSLIGVLWGLIITGTPFGIMMTGLGVISLAGVVVNNAIVLLDYVEQLREKGLETFEALVQSGLTRFRPVILTAITTVLGLVPMAIGVSVDFRSWKLIVGSSSAAFWGPMAVAIIFGLAVATVLTLVIVPTLYSIFEDYRALKARVFGRRREPAPSPAE